MTRKDYEAIAEALNTTHDLILRSPSGDDWVDAERHIAVEAAARYIADDVLAPDNPRFDRTRFLRAARGE